MSTSKPRPSAHNGTKWVDLNYDAKENAKRLNGGIQPPTKALYTSDYPNKDVWSIDNLPEVLFYLEPPKNQQQDVKPETFLRDDGTVLRKFDILPDYISVDLEGWLLHAWRCTDNRIQLGDITDRMTEDRDYFGHVLRKPPANALSNHSYRGCRKILGSYNDYARRDQPHRATVESVEKLSYEKIWTNSVLSRSVDFPDRLVRLRFVRKGKDATGQYEAKPVEVTKENYLSTTFAIDHFCIQGFDPCEVSELENKLLPAISILYDLQRKADLHMLGHWKDLPKGCMPESWFDRTKEGAPKKLTYDGGCETCTWRPDQDATSPKAQALNFNYLRQRNAEKSQTIDLNRAFLQNTTMVSAISPDDGRSLKRDRASSVEQDVQRSVTPVASHSTMLGHPSSAPAALRTKRIKLRTSNKSDKDTVVLEEDRTVPELPPAVPLEKGTRYKIKYLEKDDQYNGFWETDTEVELDSDAETVVDRTDDVQTNPKALLPPPSFPTSPPNTPYQILPQTQTLPVEGLTDPTDTYPPLQATGYFPVDFLDPGYGRNNLLFREHPHNLPLFAGTPPEDPFSSFVSSSSFENFVSQEPWYNSPFSDYDAPNLALSSTRLRGESMNTLLQHSAALHSVMGLNSVQNPEKGLPDMNFGERTPEPGSESGRHIIRPPFVGDSSSYPQSNMASKPISCQDVVTPFKRNGKDFSNLIFTDEVNRFEGFGNHPSGTALQESPLKNLGRTSEPSLDIYPTSPSRASIRNPNRRSSPSTRGRSQNSNLALRVPTSSRNTQPAASS